MTETAAPLGLMRSPYSYQFFQAVRLLKRYCRGAAPGGFAPPSQEIVRFCSHQSLAFPASEIQSLTPPENGKPMRMTVNFMGLTGPQGALPRVYTAFVLERLRARDTTTRDFFDIFNHRIVSLFYRAWEKYRFAVGYESGERRGLYRYLLDLLGLGTPGLQDRQAVADETFIFYAGLFSQRPRSATALQQILTDYFGVPVEVEQFVGTWYPLDHADQCEINETPSFPAELGHGTIVGDEVWYQQSRVRVTLGPLSRSQYLDFLPGGTAHEPLRALTRYFGNREIEFEARLVLRREETPGCALGAEADETPRLGWMTWANTVGMDRDPADTVLPL